MTYQFKTIGLVGKPRNNEAIATHAALYKWLCDQGIHTLVDDRLKDLLPLPPEVFQDLLVIGEQADLAIRSGIGFQTFEAFLSIVQASGSDVYGHGVLLVYFQFTPGPVFEYSPYVVVGLHDTEPQVFPVKIHM